MWFKASAPGSLMLLGEYGVLEGGRALVAAVDQRINVKLIPRNDFKVTISSALGQYEGDHDTLTVQAPFQFVLTALKKFPLPSGCDLQIESEFSDQIGFASSAAVTVATLTVVHEWLNKTITHDELIIKARTVVREVQGIGSGADVAACVLGGVVAYRAEPFHAEKIVFDCPLTIVYSGSKTKTVNAIQHVQHYFSAQPELYKKLTQAIDACAQSGVAAAKTNNQVELGKIMNIQQGLMESLGVCTPALKEIIDHLRNHPAIHGAKISGSGLGDCVVGLGSVAGINGFNVKLSTAGVRSEKS